MTAYILSLLLIETHRAALRTAAERTLNAATFCAAVVLGAEQIVRHRGNVEEYARLRAGLLAEVASATAYFSRAKAFTVACQEVE